MSIHRIYIVSFWLFCFVVYRGNAQNIFLQLFEFQNNTYTNYSSNYKQLHSGIQEAKTYTIQYIQQLQKQGYLTCTLDTISVTSNTVQAYFFKGKKFSTNYITLTYNSTDVNANPTTVNSLASLANIPQLLTKKYATIGYPFCTVHIDSVYEKNTQLSAAIAINKGLLYTADSIVVNGKINISERFINKTIQLQKGSIYNQLILTQIDEKINALPFLQTNTATSVTMLASTYRTNIFLSPKKSNQIHVLVGMMPSNNQNNNKTLFTGEATLQLYNAFAKGEFLYLHWQQLQPQTPLLDIQWQQPYIFNSMWSSSVKFNLFKRDSSFLNIDGFIGAQLASKKNSKIQVGIQFFSTNIITVDTALIKLTKQLPTIADVRSNVVNVGYLYNSTNKLFNPTKGLLLEANSFFGSKNILRNNSIIQLSNSNFNFNSLYDSIELNTYQLKISTKLQYIVPIKKQQLLVLQQHNGWLQSGNYFTNELYRIGGIKLLRGFDEESILANRYAIFSAAYRLQLGDSGFFETFIDGGFTGNAVTNQNNNFISAGFGLALQSKQGILNIAIANGKQNNVPFNFRQTKLHIGFVSLF